MTVGVLRYTLIVRKSEVGDPVALLAGEPVPEWASDLVHPDDLVGSESESEPVLEPDDQDAPAPAKKTAAKRAASSKTEK